MTDAQLDAILAKPLTKKPWDDAAKWLKANGNPDAASRVRKWAAARKELRTSLRWDQPATLEATQAAANGLPEGRCRRLFLALLDWLDERFPWPALSFPTWQEPWTTPRVRLIQQLHALGAVDDATFGAANDAVNYAYGCGQSESECAADDAGDSLVRQHLLARGNMVADATAAMQYALHLWLPADAGGQTEADFAGRSVGCAVRAAGQFGEWQAWIQVMTDAAAAGRADPRGSGRTSPALQWAEANGVELQVRRASAEAQAVARAGLHSLATWSGWVKLAEELG